MKTGPRILNAVEGGSYEPGPGRSGSGCFKQTVGDAFGLYFILMSFALMSACLAKSDAISGSLRWFLSLVWLTLTCLVTLYLILFCTMF